MGFDNYTDMVQYILALADEIDAGGTASDSPFYGLMDELTGEVHLDLRQRHPWIDLMASAPGVFLTVAAITNRTLTLSAAGTNVEGALSSTVSTDLTNYKINPSGKSWSARITSQGTLPSAKIFVDAAPETVTAGTACAIYQDEITLASDLGLFADGLWDQAGHFVSLVSSEALIKTYPDPPKGARIAACFARLTRTKIRLSQYPTAIRRYEYQYVKEIATPSGSSTMELPEYLRAILVQGVLARLWQLKMDRRQGEAQARYEAGIERAIGYETRRRVGLGMLSQRARQGGYADSRFGR